MIGLRLATTLRSGLTRIGSAAFAVFWIGLSECQWPSRPLLIVFGTRMSALSPLLVA